MEQVISRLTNRIVIGQYIAIIVLVIAVAGIRVEEITTWGMLGTTIIEILSNPFIFFSILYNIFAGMNNPTSKKHF